MKPKLLVVDDEENLRELYRLELEEEGYEVDTAINAVDVMSKLDSGKYEIIVLDIQMPGMPGIDLLQKIVARDRRQSVILHTSFASYRDNFMTWPAEAYVGKSSDTSALKQAIKKVLGEKP